MIRKYTISLFLLSNKLDVDSSPLENPQNAKTDKKISIILSLCGGKAKSGLRTLAAILEE